MIYVHLWQNSTLFQDLEIRFYNSILSIPRGNPVTAREILDQAQPDNCG